MRRADRLFQIIHALQGRRSAMPARRLAELLQVSQRTIYRDISDLQTSGVPVEGEAGVGYMLRKGSDIPPLMFTADELEALVIGARFVRAFAGARMASAAQSAMTKIEAVLPEELKQRQGRTRIFAPVWQDRVQKQHAQVLDRLHEAIESREVLAICYRDLKEQTTRRDVEPLCLAFWGGSWTLGGWCRLRRDFRNFRLDRISVFDTAGEHFQDTVERGMRAYLAALHPHSGIPSAADRDGSS
ncbi:MAG: YafY family protein [Rhodanobacteraceae bacterium]